VLVFVGLNGLFAAVLLLFLSALARESRFTFSQALGFGLGLGIFSSARFSGGWCFTAG
jgi:hypothetical protein